MSSSTASSQLEAALYDITNISDYRIFPLLLETVLIAFFTVLVAYFVYHRVSKGPSGGKTWMLAFTLFSFALAVAAWGLDIRILYLELYGLLPQHLSSSPDPNIDAALAQNHGALRFAQNVIADMIFMVSDCITFWRVYIVFGRPRWLRVTALCFLVIQTGFWACLCFAQTYSLPNPPEAVVNLVTKHPNLALGLNIVPYALVATGQAAAALLIACTTWRHWKYIKVSLGQSRSIRSVAVLSIITETGMVYAALMIVAAASQSSAQAIYYWSEFFITPLAAMYPTLVVVIIAVHGSYIERSIAHAPDLPTIQFSASAAAARPGSCATSLPEVLCDDTEEKDEKVLDITMGFPVLAAGASSAATHSSARLSSVSIAIAV